MCKQTRYQPTVTEKNSYKSAESGAKKANYATSSAVAFGQFDEGDYETLLKVNEEYLEVVAKTAPSNVLMKEKRLNETITAMKGMEDVKGITPIIAYSITFCMAEEQFPFLEPWHDMHPLAEELRAINHVGTVALEITKMVCIMMEDAEVLKAYN